MKKLGFLSASAYVLACLNVGFGFGLLYGPTAWKPLSIISVVLGAVFLFLGVLLFDRQKAFLTDDVLDLAGVLVRDLGGDSHADEPIG